MVEYTKIKSKKFKLKQDAVSWAKNEKKNMKEGFKIQWETNKLEGDSEYQWEAVIYGTMR